MQTLWTQMDTSDFRCDYLSTLQKSVLEQATQEMMRHSLNDGTLKDKFAVATCVTGAECQVQEETETKDKEGESVMTTRERTKSLRALAKELGVSPSYLSQVRHGKRPASQKVLSKVLSNSTVVKEGHLAYNSSLAGESSSGRTADSGSVSPGSNPGSPASLWAILKTAAPTMFCRQRTMCCSDETLVPLGSRQV